MLHIKGQKLVPHPKKYKGSGRLKNQLELLGRLRFYYLNTDSQGIQNKHSFVPLIVFAMVPKNWLQNGPIFLKMLRLGLL